jgi:3-hydroxybutyryl-CoA dehydratase
MTTNIRPHDRFSSAITLTPDGVSAYAHTVGDENPVHHDPDFAARTRFGRPIASGTQTTAHLMALTATHFSKIGAMLGLEFWFRFRKPVYADETISLEWLVVAVKENARLGGDVVELRGRVRNSAGETAVGAKGRVLVTGRL